MISSFFRPFLVLLVAATFGAALAAAQGPSPTPTQQVRTVSIPISIFLKKELKQGQPEEFIQADRLVVKEDKQEQQILSIRAVSDTPLSLAIIIQDDLTDNINLQLRDIAEFIRRLPKGSRVMVGYARGGTLITRQKFTDDLEKAAASVRIVSGVSSGGSGPYSALNSALKRFEALPYGRRAVLLISDGVDLSQGPSPGSMVQTIDLERAIDRANKYGVAVYTFYSPSALGGGPLALVTNGGQGALLRLAGDTGGRAFFQGTGAPVSFLPFFKELNVLLGRQFLLTYLSTHPKKGYHTVEVTSTNPEVKIEHPKGYYYR